MNKQEITLSNFYRFCHRTHRNEAVARNYKSNLRCAGERVEEYGLTPFTAVRSKAEVLLLLEKAQTRHLLTSAHCSAVRKYAAYLDTFRHTAA